MVCVNVASVVISECVAGGCVFVVSARSPAGCLTSTIAFRAVSAPMLRAVPGTLLLMVAGSIHIGMQNSS